MYSSFFPTLTQVLFAQLGLKLYLMFLQRMTHQRTFLRAEVLHVYNFDRYSDVNITYFRDNFEKFNFRPGKFVSSVWDVQVI